MQADLGEAWTLDTHQVVTISMWDAVVPYLQAHSLDAVDFLSLDIEGHEDEVLEAFFEKSAQHQNAPLVGAIAVEVIGNEKVKRIRDILESHGYVLDKVPWFPWLQNIRGVSSRVEWFVRCGLKL